MSDPPHHSLPSLDSVRKPARTIWHWLRYLVGVALAGVAVYVLTGRTDELSGASDYLSHLDWGFVGAAVAAEVLSVLAFAALQRRLLWAGHVDVSMRTMTGITLAGTAIQNSLPGGVVLSAVFSFRQYRLRGADDLLATWALVAMTAVSDLALVLLAAVGLGLAASSGSAFDLVETIIGLVGLAIVVVVIWIKRAWVIERVARPLGLFQRVFHRPRGNAQELVDEALRRLSALTPSRRDWAWTAGCAMANWVADLACLGFGFWALDAGVPWRGLLLAYTAGQLAANLPITPGGLGVVEGSLTIALVAFGGGKESTVAAVLLYRIISFWAAVPIGWASWALVTWETRASTRASTRALRSELNDPDPLPVRGGAVTPRLRVMATGLAVALIGLLAACGGPFNTLATADSVCFRGLPVAKAAVHSQGTLVGVRRVQTKTLQSRIEHKLHETNLTLPPTALTDETQLCAFAFRGKYPPGAVALATNTRSGKYAVVLVGSKHVMLIGAVVLPALPQRFRHPHVKP